jgi:hypothetical protein
VDASLRSALATRRTVQGTRKAGRCAAGSPRRGHAALTRARAAGRRAPRRPRQRPWPRSSPHIGLGRGRRRPRSLQSAEGLDVGAVRRGASEKLAHSARPRYSVGRHPARRSVRTGDDDGVADQQALAAEANEAQHVRHHLEHCRLVAWNGDQPRTRSPPGPRGAEEAGDRDAVGARGSRAGGARGRSARRRHA